MISETSPTNVIKLSINHASLDNDTVGTEDAILFSLLLYRCYAVDPCPTFLKQKDIHLRNSHKSLDKHIEVA